MTLLSEPVPSLPSCSPSAFYSLLGLAGADAVGCRSQAIRGLWCGSRPQLFRCPEPRRSTLDCKSCCRTRITRMLAIAATERIYGRNRMPPDPSPASSGSSVRGPEPRPETRKGRPRLWPPFFGVGAPSMNPPRKTATDGDGVRGKRAGGHPAPACPSAGNEDRQRGADRAGRDQRRHLPRKAK